MADRKPPASSAPAKCEWVHDSLEKLKSFPDDVQDVIGFAIRYAQNGGKHPNAKPLTGDKAFKGAGVLEIVDDFDGDTYRAAYTVRFRGVVYVLDAFQKKSKKGSKTPKTDMDRIKSRLKTAQEHYNEHYAPPKGKE